ncbi:hypothetical protein SprV_0501876100 [Sparganum proliferum]
MWRQGEAPQDFKDVTIVHPQKRKGSRQLYDNHRDTSLLNITGKIFACIIFNRLNSHLEQGLQPESQCDFRREVPGDAADPSLPKQTLTKAFNTMDREGLWKIVQKFDCPERFIQMVRQLHDEMTARATDNGVVSRAFAVTNGVKQDCVLEPTLFGLTFYAMLMGAYRDERSGIRVAYRMDGHFLNQLQMHFQSRVSATSVHELLFADECALNATSEGHMQRNMDLFAAACENYGLIVDTEKTVVMHQPPPDAAYILPQMNVNGV